MKTDILSQIEAAEEALKPHLWRKHYTDGHEGTVTPDDTDRWEYDGIASPDYYEEYIADIYCWPEGGPVKPRPHEELILLMANNIKPLVECARALKEIDNFEDGPDYHDAQCSIHAEETEEDGCDCGYWSMQFAQVKVKLITSRARGLLAKLKGKGD